MRTFRLHAGAFLLLTCTVPAQIQLSVQAANDAGVALERSGGTRAVQTFAAGTTFATLQSVHIAEGSLGGILGRLGLGASMHLDHLVSPPGPGPISALPGSENVQLATSVSAARGATFDSLHTTGDAAGTPGPQIYDVTLMHAGPTQALVNLRVSARLQDPNSTTSIKVTGGGIQQTWAWTGPTTFSERKTLAVAFTDAVTLRVEFEGATTAPGGGTFADGFDAALFIHAAVLADSAHDLPVSGDRSRPAAVQRAPEREGRRAAQQEQRANRPAGARRRPQVDRG